MQIDQKMIKALNSRIAKNDLNKLLMNAVSRVDLYELSINRELMKGVDFTFSDELEVSLEATAQQKVGVCWLFAAMNLMRYYTRKNINLKNFEFSGPYLMFWDKLEKANYFLEKVIEFRNRDYHDRELSSFLKEPLPDGGDWYMFVNLVKKYGMIPASVMQHSAYSKDSTMINKVLATKLRRDAAEIRQMSRDGLTLDKIQAKRKQFIEEVYSILVICFGTPPQKFDWSYRNEDKAFFREKDITPQNFYKKYVGLDLDEYVSVWSSPLSDTPYNQVYSMAHVRKMVGGNTLLSLNIDFKEFKDYALNKLKQHEPVLFSCDVTKDCLRKEGLLLKNLYNFDLVFQTPFRLEKADRLEMGETSMTHCMLIVGVDLDDAGQPVKWKIENSWGAEVGSKGYFTMSDEWFDDNVYQLIVTKKDLGTQKLALLDQEPVVLPLWHALG